MSQAQGHKRLTVERPGDQRQGHQHSLAVSPIRPLSRVSLAGRLVPEAYEPYKGAGRPAKTPIRSLVPRVRPQPRSRALTTRYPSPSTGAPRRGVAIHLAGLRATGLKGHANHVLHRSATVLYAWSSSPQIHHTTLSLQVERVGGLLRVVTAGCSSGVTRG